MIVREGFGISTLIAKTTRVKVSDFLYLFFSFLIILIFFLISIFSKFLSPFSFPVLFFKTKNQIKKKYGRCKG